MTAMNLTLDQIVGLLTVLCGLVGFSILLTVLAAMDRNRQWVKLIREQRRAQEARDRGRLLRTRHPGPAMGKPQYDPKQWV